MNPFEYQLMFQVEDRHWWYQGMASISRAFLNRWYLPGGNLEILDAGCGTGASMAGFLAEYGRVTGADISACALGFCQQRALPNLTQASIMHLPFADHAFDVVTSFDVLSDGAVPNDLSPIKEFFRVLIPGGRVLLRLPAYPWPRGRHDQAVLTVRRYTVRTARSLLEQAGFYVEHVSYANTLLFPLIVLKRFSEHLLPPRNQASDLQFNPGSFNALLKSLLSLEAGPAASRGLPFGVSLFILGRRL